MAAIGVRWNENPTKFNPGNGVVPPIGSDDRHTCHFVGRHSGSVHEDPVMFMVRFGQPTRAVRLRSGELSRVRPNLEPLLTELGEVTLWFLISASAFSRFADLYD